MFKVNVQNILDIYVIFLQSINGGTKPANFVPPSGVFNKYEQGAGPAGQNGMANMANSGNNASPTDGSNLSTGDSESGYSSHGGDTPSSTKSHSPVVSQAPGSGPSVTQSQTGPLPAHITIKTENTMSHMPVDSNGQLRPHHSSSGHAAMLGGHQTLVPNTGQQGGAVNLSQFHPHTGPSQTYMSSHGSKQHSNMMNPSLQQHGNASSEYSGQRSTSPLSHLAHMQNRQSALAMGGSQSTSSHKSLPSQIEEIHSEGFRNMYIKQEPDTIPAPSCSSQLSPHADPEMPPLGTIETLIPEAREEPTGERLVLVNQVIETIADAHLSTCNYTSEKVAAGMKKYQENLKENPSGMVSDPTELLLRKLDYSPYLFHYLLINTTLLFSLPI